MLCVSLPLDGILTIGHSIIQIDRIGQHQLRIFVQADATERVLRFDCNGNMATSIAKDQAQAAEELATQKTVGEFAARIKSARIKASMKRKHRRRDITLSQRTKEVAGVVSAK